MKKVESRINTIELPISINKIKKANPGASDYLLSHLFNKQELDKIGQHPDEVDIICQGCWNKQSNCACESEDK